MGNREILFPGPHGKIQSQYSINYKSGVNQRTSFSYVLFFLKNVAFLLTIQGQNQAAEGRHCSISQDLAGRATHGSWDVPWRKPCSKHMHEPSTQAAFKTKLQVRDHRGKSLFPPSQKSNPCFHAAIILTMPSGVHTTGSRFLISWVSSHLRLASRA